jgi:hypothetical protein
LWLSACNTALLQMLQQPWQRRSCLRLPLLARPYHARAVVSRQGRRITPYHARLTPGLKGWPGRIRSRLECWNAGSGLDPRRSRLSHTSSPARAAGAHPFRTNNRPSRRAACTAFESNLIEMLARFAHQQQTHTRTLTHKHSSMPC